MRSKAEKVNFEASAGANVLDLALQLDHAAT